MFFFSSSTTIAVVMRERRAGTRDATGDPAVLVPENDETARVGSIDRRGSTVAPDTKAVWEFMLLGLK